MVKRIVRVSLALAVALVLAIGLYAARLVGSLETPEFKARVAREASAVIGAKVQLESLDVTLLRGIRMKGVRVQNPAGFRGDLLTVEGARFSYDLWPLLRGRVQVDELSLRRPVITLATDARGAFNYKKLPGLAPTAPKGASAGGAASLLRLAISKLSVDEGRFAIVDERNAPALRLEGASLDSSLAMEGGVLTGTGTTRIETAVLANALFLRDLKAPMKLTKERMSLAPLQASLAGGDVTGEIRVDFQPAMRYALQTSVKEASVATLLKEAGSKGTMTGDLNARAKVEGTGGVLTLKGAGQAEIKDCRWPKAPLFGILADLLQIPEIRDPRFDDCRVEFTLGGGQARTPVVSFKGPALELTGEGVTNLVSSALDYDLVLALAPALLARVPPTLRAGFKVRADGFGTVPFKVTGTTAAPRTDLAARLGASAFIEATKGGLLDRLFGKKKKPQ